MRTYQSLRRKSSDNSNAPTPNFLASRPFAVQPKPEERRSPETNGHESTLLNFGNFPPNGRLATPIQPKLTIGEPNDKYEQEADRTAAQVVQQINAPQSPLLQQQQPLQRQEIPESEAKIQPKLKFSLQRQTTPDDENKFYRKSLLPFKAEPNGMETTLQCQEMLESEAKIQPKLKFSLQRQTTPDDENKFYRKSLLPFKAEPNGMAAISDLESSIQSLRGSGQPLVDTVREPMERAFGANFSGVKVHTDAQSDRLNQSIQAKAFTTGQDIFFRQGAYEPGSRGGQELLAHELTHVVQQTGSHAPGDRQPIIHKAPAQIQRLISEADFMHLAGKPSLKARWDSSTYTKILKCLQKYATTNDQTQKTKILQELKAQCNAWLTGHTHNVDGDIEATENSDLRKADFIEGLLKEARIELKEIPDVDETPSKIMDTLKEEQQEAFDAIDKQEKAAPNAARHQLTLFSAIENPYLIPFSQKRLELRIENEKNQLKNKLPGQQRTILTGDEIKKEAAKKVLLEKDQNFKGITEAEQLAAIKKLADASNQVGHTWVKLRAFDAKDKQVKEHSFGFYPLQGYNRPELSVPGQVDSPDTTHENDASQLALDYDLSQKQYENALGMARKRLQSPPEYKLIDYNCTLFAKEIVRAAGQQFPGNAFMTVPTGAVSAITGFGQGKAFNPNALYDGLKNNQDAYIPESAKKGQAQQQQAEQRQQERQQEAKLIDTLNKYIDTEFTLKADVRHYVDEDASDNSTMPVKKVEQNKKIRIAEEITDGQMAQIEIADAYGITFVNLPDLYKAIADQLQ